MVERNRNRNNDDVPCQHMPEIYLVVHWIIFADYVAFFIVVEAVISPLLASETTLRTFLATIIIES